MDFLQSVILGAVQGLTEFLPISSSGHLVIFQKLVGLPEHNLIFDIAVHLGTLLSIFTVYFKFIRSGLIDIGRSIVRREMSDASYLMLMLILGSVPTALIGLSLKSYFEALFSNTNAVGVFLIITGSLLYFTKNKGHQDEDADFSFEKARSISWRKALIIGLAQGAAIAPGISRSGTTIATGIYLGLNRNTAAMYSFMLSIPAIMGAALLQFKDIHNFDASLWMVLAVGVISAYLSGLVGLLGVLHFVKKGRLQFFSYYLWILGPMILFYF